MFFIRFCVFWYIVFWKLITCLGQNFVPKWKFVIFHPHFCTKSILLEIFVIGPHVKIQGNNFHHIFDQIKTKNRKSQRLLLRNGPSKCADQNSKFKNFKKNPIMCIPFGRARKTEQLLRRHYMIIYYGMRGMEV